MQRKEEAGEVFIEQPFEWRNLRLMALNGYIVHWSWSSIQCGVRWREWGVRWRKWRFENSKKIISQGTAHRFVFYSASELNPKFSLKLKTLSKLRQTKGCEIRRRNRRRKNMRGLPSARGLKGALKCSLRILILDIIELDWCRCGCVITLERTTDWYDHHSGKVLSCRIRIFSKPSCREVWISPNRRIGW